MGIWADPYRRYTDSIGESAYEICPSCGGSGQYWTGEDLTYCYKCKGDCVIRARNSKGQFIRKALNQ